MAAFSAGTTHSSYLCFTAICRATYSQRKLLFGGSQVAASPSPFCRLRLELTASRLSGSLPNSFSVSSSNLKAPVCQAFDRATTWSISTAFALRSKSEVSPA